MNTDKTFEETYDLIVLGTGLVQSLLAGAIALTGRKVIHVDKNDFYGEYYSSHSIENFPISNNNNENVNNERIKSNADNENMLYFSTKNMPKLNIYESKPNHFKRKKALFQAQKKFPIGSIVDVAPFGLGFISEYTTTTSSKNNIHAVACAKVIVEWFLAHGKPAVVYLPLNKLTKPFYGQKVQTNSFGIGKLWKLRNKDNMMSVNLTWKVADGNNAILIRPQKFLFKTSQMQNMQNKYYNMRVNNDNEEKNQKNIELENLFEKSNRFCLDIIPSLMLSRGFSVDHIVSCGVSNYLEFKAIDDIYILNDLEFQTINAENDDNNNSNDEKKIETILSPSSKLFKKVPCSKSDVFTSSELSMSDKRVLMKFLRYCLDLSEDDALTLNEKSLAKGRSLKRPQNKGVDNGAYDYEKYKDQPFIAFLKNSFGVSDSLGKLLIYAIGLLPTSSTGGTSCTTRRGIVAIQRHLLALGRFGTTAFLTTLYGSGEVPQAFCRLCAVNGGIYLLRKTPLALKYEKQQDDRKTFSGIQLEDNVFIKGKCVVVGSDYYMPLSTPKKYDNNNNGASKTQQSSLARAILVATKKISNDSGKSIFVIPPNSKNIDNDSTIFMLQLDSDSYVVPKPYYVIHLTCEIADNNCSKAIESLKLAVVNIFGNVENNSSPILWNTYFTLNSGSNPSASGNNNEWNNIENVFLINSNNSNEIKNSDNGFSKTFCYQNSFEAAKIIFQRLCPGEEFLVKPKPVVAPDDNDNDGDHAVDGVGGGNRNPYQNSDDDSDMSGLDIDDSLYSDDDD